MQRQIQRGCLPCGHTLRNHSAVPPPGSWHPPQSLVVFSGSSEEAEGAELFTQGHPAGTGHVPSLQEVREASPTPPNPQSGVFSLAIHRRSGDPAPQLRRPQGEGCPASERAAGPQEASKLRASQPGLLQGT